MTLLRQQRGAAAEPTAEHPVAYFCAEYGITDTLPIYSGGLGVLAGDIVQEVGTRHYPLVAIGLFYRKGYFHQDIEFDGQHESPQPINPQAAQLSLVTDSTAETILLEVPIHERTVYVQAWKYMVGGPTGCPLYLLDTDHWKNSPEDRQITDQLYGGGMDRRIQQELVLALGGLALIRALKIEPSLFHMNEGHAAFLSLGLAAEYIAEGLSTDEALKQAKQNLVFTNHTLVPAGNDLFPNDTVAFYLGTYAHTSGIGLERILALGACEQPGSFAMTQLALRMAKHSNAVSKLHAEKALEIWPEYHFESVTNGVHLPAWMAAEWQEVLHETRPDWAQDIKDANLWKAVRKLTPERIWHIHQILKVRMLDEVYARTGVQLDHDVLTVTWARRFATYKRPDMLFSDLDRLQELLFNEERPMQVLIAGKSHPADGQGKEIIAKIERLAEYQTKHRVVMVEDYSITLSRLLVSGSDVWLNTPIFGKEASGTSGMKAAANGVLQCTVPDGWAWEVDWSGLGFSLPSEDTENGLYRMLAEQVIPLYYKQDARGIPELWTQMMRETIAELAPQFSSERMVLDYHNKLYCPTISGK